MIGRGHVTLGHKGELHHKSMQFQSIRKEKKWLRLELHILDLLTLAIRTGCPKLVGTPCVSKETITNDVLFQKAI